MMETVRSCLQEVENPRFGGEDVLLQEIREVNRQIHCNNAWFDLESNQDLIESCIYEGESLRARYRYLLGIARRQGVSAPPFHLEPKEAKE